MYRQSEVVFSVNVRIWSKYVGWIPFPSIPNDLYTVVYKSVLFVGRLTNLHHYSFPSYTYSLFARFIHVSTIEGTLRGTLINVSNKYFQSIQAH